MQVCYVVLSCNFVLTLYKNSPFINAKLFKNMLLDRLRVFQKKNSFIKKSVEQTKNKESRKRYHKISQQRKFIKYKYSI